MRFKMPNMRDRDRTGAARRLRTSPQFCAVGRRLGRFEVAIQCLDPHAPHHWGDPIAADYDAPCPQRVAQHPAAGERIVRVQRKRWVGTLSRSGGRFGIPAPRHEFVDAVLGPTVYEARQQLGHVGQRINFVELTGLDQ